MSDKKEVIPAKIGRYDIRGKLADGGMASVYAGRLAGPAGFERLCAIKIIKTEFSADKHFVNMFLDEARIAAKLNHPSIVQVHELGEEEAPDESGTVRKRLYIVMELLFGESLWDVWYNSQKKGKPIPYDIAAWLGARIAEGLHHAHELTDGSGQPQNVIHRDINPANLFVTYDGQAKIIDFGLAKAKNRISETGFGVIKGKVAYMAPEQTKSSKDIDRRADIFALGTTLWELTVNRRLFKRENNVATLTAVAEGRVPDPMKLVPEYSPALWAILKKALAKDRNERYATAKEMAEALDAFSRTRGRVVTATTISAFMNELFGVQRERYKLWLDEVSSARVPVLDAFRKETEVADDNAVLVGETQPELPAKVSEAPPPAPVRQDPHAAPKPEPVDEVKETRRAWLWAVAILVAGAATVYFAIKHLQ